MAAQDALVHGHYLYSSNYGRMTLLEREGTFSLFLLTTAQFFPGAARLFLGDMQFSAHLGQQFLELRILGLVLCCVPHSVGSRLSLLLHLGFQHCVDLLMPFQVSPCLEKPPLEFALRAGAKPLQFDNGVKEVGARGREVVNLPRELRCYRVTFDLIRVFLQPPQPEARHAFPVGGEGLPPLKSMRE
jgi:hypothetical protein